MKPLKLTLKAFGTFAKETVIDFQKFEKDGVFLIFGSNGSGKTTIFDAISFALYGKTNSKYRNAKTVHSDFCTLKEETFVKLVFSHQNKIYTVERYLKPKKEKAVIYDEYGKMIAEGTINVTNEVIKTIGMKQGEFSQTIMIAQGKFREIVDADSKTRAELFRKLFHTEIYQEFEKKLKTRCIACEMEFNTQKQALLEELHKMRFHSEFQPDILITGDISIETIKKYCNALQNQNISDKKTILELETQKITCQQERDGLSGQINNAEIINKKLQELAKTQKELQNLQHQGQRIEDKKIRLETAKRVAGIIPIEKNGIDTRNKLEEARNYHESIKNAYHSQEIICQQAEQALQNANEDAEKLDKLKQERDILEQTLPKFKEFQKIQSDYQEDTKKLKKLAQQLEDERKNYDALDRQFYLGQAGLLAEQLQSGKPCPVCGSLEHPQPAVKTESMPTKKQLENAKKLLKKTEENFYEISGKCEKLLAKLETMQKENPLLLKTNLQEIKRKLNSCHQTIQELKNTQDFAQKAFTEAKNKLGNLAGKLQESEKNIANLIQELQNYRQKFKTALQKQGFTSIEDYEKAKSDESAIKKLEQEIQNYEIKITQLQTTIRNLEQEIDGKSEVQITSLREKQTEKETAYHYLIETCKSLKDALSHNQEIMNRLPSKIEAYRKMEEEYSSLDKFYHAVSGHLIGEEKLALEAFVQQQYFQQVILRAKQRLAFLTDNKFDLRHRETARNLSSKSGLDLEILDRATGQWRDVTTLSGGESFMLALSLALGLSDAIQESSGGIQIDAMFIDEGFGTLDETALNQAIALLGKLADGKRLIGVISHVESLINRIDSKIYVTKKANGSEVRIH